MDDLNKYLIKDTKIELFLNIAGKTMRYYSVITEISGNKFFITPPKYKESTAQLAPGEEIKFYLYTNSGVYNLSSYVIKPGESVINKGYWITLPHASQHIQRREYLRSNVSIPIVLHIVKDAQTQVFSGVTKNLSAKGLRFLCDYELDYDSLIVEMKFGYKVIKTECEVLTSRPETYLNRTKYSISLLFTTIEPFEMDYIVKACFKYQLTSKKQETDMI